MMFKSKLALAVALGLGMSSPLWAAQASVAGESVEARLAALEARVQAAEARAEAAESRASQAEVKASAASEKAQVANNRSQKVDEKTAGAQGFELPVGQQQWQRWARRPLHHASRFGGWGRRSPWQRG